MGHEELQTQGHKSKLAHPEMVFLPEVSSLVVQSFEREQVLPFLRLNPPLI